MFGGFFSNIQSSSFQYTPFLENLTVIPEFAWSVWQPHTSVANCVRLRRSSDNSELDFGYVNGYVDVDSIASWGGVDELYVVTFYGYNRTATENTIGNQLQWFNSGGVNNLAGYKIRRQGTSSSRYYLLSSPLLFQGEFTTATTFHYTKDGSGTVHPTFYHVSTARYWININSTVTPEIRIVLTPNTPSYVTSYQPWSLNDAHLIILERDSSGIIEYDYNNNIVNNSDLYAQDRNATHLFSRMDTYNDVPTFIGSEFVQGQTKMTIEDKAQFITDYNKRYNQSI